MTLGRTYQVDGANLGGPIDDQNGFWLYVRLVQGNTDLPDLDVGASTLFEDRPDEGTSRYTITRLS